MLVWIRDILKSGGPGTAQIWLQRFNRRNVCVVNSVEKVARSSARGKCGGVFLDRKLGPPDTSGIADRQLVDQVVKSGPKVVADFPA